MSLFYQLTYYVAIFSGTLCLVSALAGVFRTTDVKVPAQTVKRLVTMLVIGMILWSTGMHLHTLYLLTPKH